MSAELHIEIVKLKKAMKLLVDGLELSNDTLEAFLPIADGDGLEMLVKLINSNKKLIELAKGDL